MIEVCCAIILRGSEILAVQRGPMSSHPWKWEFPGGKINLEETPEQCIVREIEEELAISIEVIDQLSTVDFDYGQKQIRLIPFTCRILSGETYLTEHVAQCWFAFKEWDTLDWLEADHQLIVKNKEMLKLRSDYNRLEPN